MKKIIYLLVAVLLIFTGCAQNSRTFSTIQDFKGSTIASLNGSIFAKFIDPKIPGVKHLYFNTLPDQIAAVTSGKADAVALDLPVAKLVEAQISELMVFPEIVAEDRYGFAVKKGSELGVQGNEILKKLRNNGTLKQMEDYWFSADISKKEMPKLDYKEDFNGSAGKLIYGCETATEPMSYIGANGKPLGFDLDLAARIAYELNMEIEFLPMNFDALLMALSMDKVNMVGGCMSMSEERKKSVDFIGPYYEGGISFVIKKDAMAAQ